MPLNNSDFTPNSAGQVIRVGAGEAAYSAFVPAPLPPPLTLDPSLVRTLSEADRALGELAGLGRAIANPHLLIQPFIRREAVLSSRIEGTQADVTDLYAFEAGQLPLPGISSSTSEPDVREVLNYVHALEYGLERINELPVSLRLLRELHERLMHDVRGGRASPGEFRTTQNWIGGNLPSDARFVPPPPAQMHDALDAFEKYLHADDGNPPLLKLGLIHYQFESIHPFVDGNGRIGRLLISLLLVHWNLLPLPLLYLSAFFERNRQQYYDHLISVSQKGSWENWLRFFLSGVAEQARDAVNRARQLQDLQAFWRNSLQESRATTLSLRLADHLFERPVISTTYIRERYGVALPTALRALRQLESLGIVKEVTGQFRNQRYIAEQILAVLDLTST